MMDDTTPTPMPEGEEPQMPEATPAPEEPAM